MRALRQKRILAADTGFNATAIDTATDGSAVECRYFEKVTVYVNYTLSAGTGYEFNLEVSDDGGKTWFYVPAVSIAAGTGTASRYKVSRTEAASALMVFSFEINASHLRVANLLSLGTPDSGDKATITMLLGAI
jgi:hypothetical protein